MVLLVFMTAAAAVGPGSVEDSIILLGDLDSLGSALKSEAAGTLGGAADRAVARLDGIYKSHVGYRFAPRYVGVSLAAGDTVTLSAGSSFILLSGSARLAVVSGSVINVTTGGAAASGAALAANQRYFCVEDTEAVVTAGAASVGRVDGYYMIDGAEPVMPRHPFVDVKDSDWFCEAVVFAYENKIFAGTSADKFSPDNTMTRAMFVTVLHRLDGAAAPEVGGGVDGDGGDGARRFADVPDGEWYTDAVAWASANGIVAGYDDGTFRPGASVTREQMATFLYRYAGYKGLDMADDVDALSRFPDKGDVSAYAQAPMRWAVSRAIINGSNGSLLPRRTATRAQVAQLIANFVRN